MIFEDFKFRIIVCRALVVLTVMDVSLKYSICWERAKFPDLARLKATKNVFVRLVMLLLHFRCIVVFPRYKTYWSAQTNRYKLYSIYCTLKLLQSPLFGQKFILDY